MKRTRGQAGLKGGRVQYRKRQRRAVRRGRVGIGKSMVNRELHLFKRNALSNSLTGAAGYAPYLSGTSFTLSQLPGVADFTTLFDRYMITHIQYKIYLTVEPGAQSAAAATRPKLFYVKDYDDVTTPGSLNELREHASCKVKVMNPNYPVVINLKPAVLAETYRSAVTTTYTPKWRQWIDMVATDCPHYGIKWGIDDLTNTNYKITTETVFWFACKDTR